MPDEAAVELRRMGVKVILNKSTGMPAVGGCDARGIAAAQGGVGFTTE